MDLGQGIAVGASNAMEGIGQAMQQYHKEHESYDQQLAIANAISRLGIDKSGNPVSLYDNEGKKLPDVQPLLNTKAYETYVNVASNKRSEAAGALKAINAIAMQRAQHMVTQDPTYTVPTQYGNVQATGGQAISSGFERERIDLAKQPKPISQDLQYRMQKDLQDRQQKAIENRPEYKFNQKYGVQPMDIVGQQDSYALQYTDPKTGQVQTAGLGITRDPTGALYGQGVIRREQLPGNPTDPKDTTTPQANSYYTPTTPVYREKKYEISAGGVKQESFKPDPEGDFMFVKGQHIPINDYQAMLQHANVVRRDALEAYRQGKDPNAIRDYAGRLGYDPEWVLPK